MKCKENPWNIDSLYKLQYFICPACIFTNHSKQEIINHAFEIHPDSIDFLTKIKDDSITDIIWPFVEQDVSEDPLNIENIKTEEFGTTKEFANREILNCENSSKNINEIADEIEINNAKNETIDVGCHHKSGRCQCPNKSIIKCDICGNIFTTPRNLSQHIKRIHDKIKDIKCDICGKMFAGPTDIRTHKTHVHKGVKNYNCEFCHKAFNNLSGLRNHIKCIHDKVKDQICDICGKGFSLKIILDLHVKNVHNKIKDHPCTHCEKMFGTKSDAKKHIVLVHEGVKKYICDTCGRAFQTPNCLKNHVKYIHEKIMEEHKCEPCGKNFTRYESLIKHNKKVHK